MTRTWRPYRLVHRGVVPARAVLVDTALIGESEARARVLRLWTRGTRVYRTPSGWLVRLPETAMLDTARSSGTVLVEQDDALVAFPLSTEDRKLVSVPPGSMARLAAGAVEIVALLPTSLESPASWLDLSAFAVVSVEPLGAPPPASRAVFEDAPPFDARARLPGIPEAAPERAAILEALRAGTAPGTGGRRRSGPPRLGWLRALASWMARQLAGHRSASSTPGTAPAPGTALGWLARLGDAVNRALSRLLMLTRLESLVGRRHAEYLAQLVEMLEQGDVENGLRHAIPLDGPAAESIRRALTPPTPRAALVVRPAATAARVALPMELDLVAHLRQLYRATFQRLAGQGRVEEAAFVLAELLHANEEAVAFLERNGRLELAAEMAEARELAPSLVVRQWFLAGRRDRAVEIARRRNAFADAVARLERSAHGEDAAALRLLWADSLAAQGDYSAAVDVIWNLPAARDLARGWIVRGIDQGGPAGAAMLVRRLELDPGAFEEVKERALALLEAEDAEGVATRLALVDALTKGNGVATRATLARAASRAALRDAALFGTGLTREKFKKLVDVAGDGALRTDLPLLTQAAREPLAQWTTPVTFVVEAHDVGTVDVHDACLLPDGKVMVALGEAGVLIRARDGRAVGRLEVPAHRLVLADAADRALTLAPRGESYRLARLDLVRRRVDDWCDARLQAFAETYDGSRWFVAAESDLWAIDTAARGFDGPWRVPDLSIPPGVGAIARSRQRCSVFVAGPRELWTYELPGYVLRSRRAVPPGRAGVAAMAVTPAGLIAIHDGVDGAPLLSWTAREETWQYGRPGEPGERPGPLVASERWLAAVCHGPDSARVLLYDVASGGLRAKIRLMGSRRIVLRMQEDRLVVGDDRGRLLALDLDQGWLVCDLRL